MISALKFRDQWAIFSYSFPSHCKLRTQHLHRSKSNPFTANSENWTPHCPEIELLNCKLETLNFIEIELLHWNLKNQTLPFAANLEIIILSLIANVETTHSYVCNPNFYLFVLIFQFQFLLLFLFCIIIIIIRPCLWFINTLPLVFCGCLFIEDSKILQSMFLPLVLWNCNACLSWFMLLSVSRLNY